MPKIDGFWDFFGKSIHNCPYCDAWEHRNGAIAVYGKGERGYELTLSLNKWTNDLVVCTDGHDLTKEQILILNKKNIKIRSEKISRFNGTEGQLESILFEKF